MHALGLIITAEGIETKRNGRQDESPRRRPPSGLLLLQAPQHPRLPPEIQQIAPSKDMTSSLSYESCPFYWGNWKNGKHLKPENQTNVCPKCNSSARHQNLRSGTFPSRARSNAKPYNLAIAQELHSFHQRQYKDRLDPPRWAVFFDSDGYHRTSTL